MPSLCYPGQSVFDGSMMLILASHRVGATGEYGHAWTVLLLQDNWTIYMEEGSGEYILNHLHLYEPNGNIKWLVKLTI